MDTYYYYSTCPHCGHEGRLIITENITEDKLYLHCDECEWGYRHPHDVGIEGLSFLTLLEEFETVNPTIEKIKAMGWGEYALHKFEDKPR